MKLSAKIKYEIADKITIEGRSKSDVVQDVFDELELLCFREYVAGPLESRDINTSNNESSIACVPAPVAAVLTNDEKQAAYQAQRDARRLILPALEYAEPSKRVTLEKLHPLEEINIKPTPEQDRIKKEDADRILREADLHAAEVLKSYGITGKL